MIIGSAVELGMPVTEPFSISKITRSRDARDHRCGPEVAVWLIRHLTERKAQSNSRV